MANEISEQEKQNGLQRIFQAVSQPAAGFISAEARLLRHSTGVVEGHLLRGLRQIQ